MYLVDIRIGGQNILVLQFGGIVNLGTIQLCFKGTYYRCCQYNIAIEENAGRVPSSLELVEFKLHFDQEYLYRGR